MSDTSIVARAVSGFPEFLPAEQIALEKVKRSIQQNFERFGFVPLETPAIETKEILTAKSGINNEIYAVTRLVGEVELKQGLESLAEQAEDVAGAIATAKQLAERAQTELALHFDLTVPLARYVVQHKDKLVFPFRRYQIQKVWRGERPGSGRFREFYQCDIDVIGRGSLSLLNDAEIPSIIYRIFRELAIGKFTIRLSNRKILLGYLQTLGVAEEHLAGALRAIDKLEKIGPDKTVHELHRETGMADDRAQQVIAFLGQEQDTDATLQRLRGIDANGIFRSGIEELAEVVAGVRLLGVPDDHFRVDLGIARGLDYYTGTVYETVLDEYPQLGSICSGGRYDNLAGHFGGEAFPGVGISIGLTRLLSRLFAEGLLQTGANTTAPVLVTALDPAHRADYLRFATALREAGIGAELYLEQASLGAQLKFANRKGFRLAVIAGGNEFERGEVQLKDLAAGRQLTCTQSALVETAGSLLEAPPSEPLY